jgi:1,4-alpha-glucan branching enzyme
MTSMMGNGVVCFEFFRRDTCDVRLVGDFTGWNARPLVMHTNGDGWWKLAVRLSGGEYRFCYRADGQDYPDYAAHGIEMNPDGVRSVLVVPAQTEANRTPADAARAA